ncbi:thiolase-like protein [Dunaliella salina]|uniref:Thiolase-like protein n=1 Tax=Dunaliella salina TaxID=3046 RepID=A0ABQ7G249_DUNSA|nr:thiolase-like protein [Dunaliella salina]|eukprot:KAF5828682.1 thiolase-like protein [Dunaliella salina]
MLGVGAAAPPTVLTNDDLATVVDTNDEWISTRTGIKRRHVMAKGETLTGLAVRSSQSALAMAGIQPDELDLIIFATSSPDDLFGSACELQATIGAKNACGFDLTAACSGFVLGVITAAQYIRTGASKKVLVVGGDALSRFVDWRDRGTCILFGDGCGAMVMTAAGAEDSAPCALLGSAMHSKHAAKLVRPCCFFQVSPSCSPRPPHKGEGGEVFKFAVRSVPQVIDRALADAGMQKEQIDWLVMHQANQRILDSVAQRLCLPADRVISNLEEYGNTSAGSIPLALDAAVRSGSIKKGDVVALAGFGAGLTWAAAIVRWG